jgi:signal transduction histidine kinase
VVADDDRVRISVADNGRGFAFDGRYEHAELASLGLGPQSLCRRVEATGGTVTIESSDAGSRLDIAVPIRGG